MLLDVPKRACCKDSISEPSRISRLADLTSTNSLTRYLANSAASALVVASAGYGAVFAWQSGSQYGLLLGCLTVLFAVALEVLKPLALATAITSFRSLDLVRGSALVLLGLVAVTYSLTSELTLMAGARGDVVATRAFLADSAKDLRNQRDRLQIELTALGTTRPASTVKAEVEGLLADRMVGNCSLIDGPRSKATCPRVSELRAELGNAERREAIETELAKPIDTKSASVGKADPGATALATYLAALSIKVDVPLLTEWLVLVPVLALEIGSALAGIVVQAVARRPEKSRTDEVKEATEPDAVAKVGHPPVQQEGMGVSEDGPTERQKVKEAIVAQLRANGGTLSSGSRGLAKKVGAKRATLRRAVNCLVISGIVAASASKHGTLLRLVS